MPAIYLPDQLERLAELLRNSMVLSSAPRLQLSSIKERDAFRDAIDAGIGVLADLKSYRNDVAAISFLPDELLCDIFYHLMMEDPWSARWSRIIKVCRRWHRVAVNDGRLWSWLNDEYSASMRMYRWLDLSKGAPLSLSLHNVYSRPILEDNHRRVVFLKFNGSHADIRPLLEPFQSLPLLDTLQIETYRDSGDGPGEQPGEYYLPQFIVQGGAPRLRHLRLSNIAFRSIDDFKCLHNLTHLDLSPDRRSSAAPSPSLREVHDVLLRSPQLEFLKLHDFIALHPEDVDQFPQPTSSSFTPISLPALRYLELWAYSAHLIAALGFLRFPSTSCVSLAVVRMHGMPFTYPQQVKAVMVQLRHHIRRDPNMPVLRSATLHCSNWLNFSFSQHETCPSHLSSEEKNIELQVWPRSQNQNRQILTQIANHLPLDQLRSLDAVAICDDNLQQGRIGDAAYVSLQTWRTLLRLLPSDLTITMGANNGAIVLLRAVIDTMRTSTTTNPKTRQQKRRSREYGLGSRPLAKLVLKARHHPKLLMARWRRPEDEEEPYDAAEDQKNLYATLQQLLEDYAQVETPLKEKEKLFPCLQITDFEHNCRRAYAVADELFTVTKELRLEERVWDPVANKKAIRRRRKWQRRARERCELPAISDHGSPLSSDHESELDGW